MLYPRVLSVVSGCWNPERSSRGCLAKCCDGLVMQVSKSSSPLGPERAPLIILQRIVPHYRDALFMQLYERFGWRVVCASNPPVRSAHRLMQGRPYMVQYPFRFNERNPYRVSTNLGHILSDLRPAAVIAEFSGRASWVRDLALGRLFGRMIPTLFWSHGANMERRNSGARDRFIGALRIGLMKMVDGQIVYSEEGRQYLARHLGNRPVFVAANALDNAAIRAAAVHAAPREGLGKPVLLSVGRLTEGKNYLLLVRAFRQLLKHYPSATLVLIGSGPEEGRLRAEAGGLIGNNIILPGGLFEEHDLAPYFKASDAFVIPGAAGLSVNHALAYGVPIVAFARGPCGPFHHPEIAYVKSGETGWLVEPYTEGALVQFLCELFARNRQPSLEMRPAIECFVDRNMSIDSMVNGFAQAREWLRAQGAAGV